LADGKILMKLLEIISGEIIGKPNKGMMRVQKVENVSRCLKFLISLKKKLHTKISGFPTGFFSCSYSQNKQHFKR
jgi:hypothetical protein